MAMNVPAWEGGFSAHNSKLAMPRHLQAFASDVITDGALWQLRSGASAFARRENTLTTRLHVARHMPLLDIPTPNT
jgi:hypothetical protein